MRQILVDQARRSLAEKRGGGLTMITPRAVSPISAPNIVDMLALDQALEELASMDARLCRVVELKFFAGLTIDETAEALEVSPATVERDWAAAKAWLYDRLTPSSSSVGKAVLPQRHGLWRTTFGSRQPPPAASSATFRAP